jgi:hypothetical protein
MVMRCETVPEISSELDGAHFGDYRLTKRLLRIANSVAGTPSASFPSASGADGELEGIYRFFSNERVCAEAILEPHFQATLSRSYDEDLLVVHDTTSFVFRGSTPRKGLGRLQRSGRAQSRHGFFGHFALAVAAGTERQPLGLLGLRTFVRGTPPPGASSGRPTWYRRDKESSRWAALALDTHASVPNALHVMDREADAYENHRALLEAGIRFVVRGKSGWKRKGVRGGAKATLPELVGATPVRLTRVVELARRAPDAVGVLNQAHPPRRERTATLSVRAASILLPRPHLVSRRDPDRDRLPLNVVLVEEVAPPRGVEPVSWMLLTNEPIRTSEEIGRVVDAYRARWVIEEFFKALKTGCSFEKRQLESFEALRNALAVLSVIAWRLLLLRSLSRLGSDAPADTVASQRQLSLLRALPHLDERRFADIALPAAATAVDVLMAVAKLGGHVKNNGPPGWQILGRGYESLLLLELGWRARELLEPM